MRRIRFHGAITLLVIVFGGIFFTVLMALSSFVLSQNRAQSVVALRSKSFAIAEAGLMHYRWLLSHFPGNTTNGTGQAGPYVTTYTDPETGATGTYSLSVTGNGMCGIVQSIDVTSTGTSDDTHAPPVTLVGRFAPKSVAAYSYIVGSTVWAGSDRVINGPYHSNGGIRMDGTANAPVSSSLSTWSCDSTFGCGVTTNKPGIFGAGTNSNLWQFPTPQVDFAAISANFNTLKNVAIAQGIYLPRLSSTTGPNPKPHIGYHLIFNANRTVTVKKVTGASGNGIIPINSGDPNVDYALIATETVLQTSQIPAQCGLIFVEDNTWIEGTIPSKITLVAAGVANPAFTPDIFIHDNITYTAYDGSAGFTAIGAHDILITPDSPSVMTLNGIFVAQSGAFGRNFYGCPGSYEPRTSLTIIGTTVSNLRTGTKWLNACPSAPGGNGGYLSRTDAFDRQNMTNPPPFTPNVSTQWEFVDWKQL